MSPLFALLACLALSAEAFSFAPATGAVSRTSNVQMSTQFTDPYVQRMKKKNPKTGSTKNLRGYTVGSRAPSVAVASGTTVKGYKTTGNLRGAPKNKQNVPTAVVLALSAGLYLGLPVLKNIFG